MHAHVHTYIRFIMHDVSVTCSICYSLLIINRNFLCYLFLLEIWFYKMNSIITQEHSTNTVLIKPFRLTQVIQ